MKNENRFIHISKVLLLAFVLTAGLQHVSAQSWTAPVSSPPANNVYAPLNVGTSVQLKNAGLIINAASPGSAYGLVVPYGKVNIGSTTPASSEKLEVAGSINLTGGGCYKVNGTCLTGGSGSLPSGILNQTMRYNGSAWVGDSNIFNTGTRVGIGTTQPQATLHVTNNSADSNGLIRISRQAGGGNSTLQLYKGIPSAYTGWAAVNNASNNFELNFDAVENGSGTNLVTVNSGNKNFGIGTSGVIDAVSKVNVGGKIRIDLLTPSYGSDLSAYRDALDIIVGQPSGAPTTDRARIITNKPNFEFWHRPSAGDPGSTASLIVENVEADGILSAQFIKLKPDNVATVPAHKFLTAVQTDGSADWKYVGAQGGEEFEALTGGRADCEPGSGKVVTGISVVAGDVTGVWCKALQAF